METTLKNNFEVTLTKEQHNKNEVNTSINALVKYNEKNKEHLVKYNHKRSLLNTTCSSRALARKERNSAFCMIWEIKLNLGSQGHCEPLSGFSGRSGGKALGKFTICRWKLV